MTTKELLMAAKKVTPILAGASGEQKNRALFAMADALIQAQEEILSANAQDVAAARGKISDVMLDRLSLNEKRISDMAEGIRQVAKLPDPVGKILKQTRRPNGLVINKVAVPMGVVAIIYESRPNVTSDAAALAIKSGNVCVLRGGKEAYASAKAIVKAMQRGLGQENLPKNLINLVEDTSRQSARELMEAVGYVDLLIPRGGAGLIRAVTENAKVNCIQTGTGICHVYVDRDADLSMALDIIENAKTSRPSVCNAEEVLLVHEAVAEKFLPQLKHRLVARREQDGKTPVRLLADPKANEILHTEPAGEQDFDREFLDYILAVKVVSNVEEAIGHILEHSTGHSEAIITDCQETEQLFCRCVDSAAVYVNASTRFTDGGEFGLGCEMGISTQKLHARGPMGLEELETYKYVIHGTGQVRG